MYVAYLILLSLAITSNCLLIFILYWYSQRVLAIVIFIILLLFINIWIGPLFIINALHANGYLFENLNRFAALGYIGTPAAFLAFALAYTKQNKLLYRFSFWTILLIPGIAFLYLSWSGDTISVHEYSRAVLYRWGYETPIGQYFYLYLLWFELLMLIGIGIIMIYYLKTLDFIKKRQALFVILSVIIPLAIGTVTNGILPLFNIYILPAAALLSSMMSPFIVFAIIRYGLFEVTPLSILSSINHAIITVDNKGKVLHMNIFSERLLKTRAALITGRPIEEMLIVGRNNGDKKNHLTYLLRQAIIKGKTIVSDTYTIMDNRRQIIPFILSITPVYSHQLVIGANIFLKDITREKAREKYKDDFISTLSHELKIPITSIKAYNQLLLKRFGDTNDQKKQIAVKIDRQLDRLTRLIQDFFELSQVQAGKINLNTEFVRIDDLVHEVVDSLLITYKDRRIEIHGKTGNVVFIDRDRITQVLINLITNAIKYSPADKKIVVSLAVETRNVLVSVKDRGIGIASEYHKKIFDQFYQVSDNSLRTAGLGIGLYISSYIIKRHGGRIWVDSVPGRGSTFYFTLPIAQ